MGTLSFWHILVIVAVVVVVFGHRHLPAALGTLGRIIAYFRKGNKPPRTDDNTIEGTFVRRDD